MMLLGKIKYKPCGAKVKIKFRAVLMGNDFVKDVTVTSIRLHPMPALPLHAVSFMMLSQHANV